MLRFCTVPPMRSPSRSESNVSTCVVPVVRSSTLMSKPGPLRDANAISLNGAADQDGRSQ